MPADIAAEDTLDQLLCQVREGSLSVEEAERQAAVPAVAARLTPDRAFHLIAGHPEEPWRPQVDRARVVLAASSAATPEVRIGAAKGWLGVATPVLRLFPHPWVYASARDAGMVARTLAAQAGDTDSEGALLYQLGNLHSSPYISMRSLATVHDELRRWRESLGDVVGAEEAARLVATHGEVPEALTALRIAEDHLEAARLLPKNPYLAETLGLLSMVLEWRLLLGDAGVAPERGREAACAALEHVDLGAQPNQAARLLATLHRFGGTLPVDVLDRLAATSLDEHLGRHGAMRTVDFAHQLSAVLLDERPRQALDLLVGVRPLLPQVPESARASHWRSEIINLITVYAPDAMAPPQVPPRQAAMELNERFKAGGMEAREVAGRLLALAYHAGPEDPELSALLVGETLRQAPVLAAGFVDAVAHVQTQLDEVLAVRAAQQGDTRTSARSLIEALGIYIRLGLGDLARNALRSLEHVGRVRDAMTLNLLVSGLATTAPKAEALLGDVAVERLQRIYRRCVASAGSLGESNPDLWLCLLQLSKGMRLGTALATPSSYRLADDTEARDLLAEVATARTVVEAAGVAPQPLVADEDEVLAVYVRSDLSHPGATPEERHANLCQRFDDLLARRLMPPAPEVPAGFLTFADVRDALDERTVLLDICLGTSVVDRVTAYLTVISREGSQIFSALQDWPDEPMAFSAHVADLRRCLLRAPIPPSPVDGEAGDLLEEDFERLFPPQLREWLAAARARGCDRLLVVPHGPLHFYPIHLLGPIGRPLGVEWTVSYLPSLWALGGPRRRRLRRWRARPLAAVGLGFASDPDYPSIPEAVAECEAIAAAAGAAPVLDSRATPAAIHEALAEARVAHVATHGRNRVEAPAFQSLVVAGEAGGHVDLSAYELTDWDLSGLELVTLGACETGLGRFDRGDNLRGLPATLLLAGAESLVTTLWSVGSESSRVFFERLHEERRKGAARLDAFAAAQRETRERHPEYRRWGAFTMMGMTT